MISGEINKISRGLQTDPSHCIAASPEAPDKSKKSLMKREINYILLGVNYGRSPEHSLKMPAHLPIRRDQRSDVLCLFAASEKSRSHRFRWPFRARYPFLAYSFRVLWKLHVRARMIIDSITRRINMCRPWIWSKSQFYKPCLILVVGHAFHSGTGMGLVLA